MTTWAEARRQAKEISMRLKGSYHRRGRYSGHGSRIAKCLRLTRAEITRPNVQRVQRGNICHDDPGPFEQANGRSEFGFVGARGTG